MTVNLADGRTVSSKLFVVMGVTGSGKSTVGAALARTLRVDFVEGDDYHPMENVRRMASGIPLTDEDRSGWLAALAERIRDAKSSNAGIVLSCSALKRSYRDVLRAAAPELQFVFFKGSESLIAGRIAARQGHFMPASLLESQLAILEEPSADEDVWTCDINKSVQEIVDSLVLRSSE
jgi:carbohydrate kinase (thermoresistant glucokinase family)